MPLVEVSAKSGVGVGDLLETISLVAEVHEIKGDPSLAAHAVVIEANLDKFKGPIATLLIRNGTLKKGETLFLGGVESKIRGMLDFSGKSIDEAGPSMPVEVLGLEEVPQVGGYIGEDAQIKEKADVLNLLERLKQDKTKRLNLVVKADKAGSLEALEASLQKFNEGGEEHIKIVFSGTGAINDSDIKLGASSSAIVLGFNVEPVTSAKKLAETEQVLVRTYTIIYELLEEIEDVVESMLKVGAIEEIYGTAQIIAEFPYGKNVRIAGCKVLDGQITKGPKIKIVRGEEIIGETKIKSLKKVKEEVVRVEAGDECGMMFEPQVEFLVGDVIQSFRTL